MPASSARHATKGGGGVPTCTVATCYRACQLSMPRHSVAYTGKRDAEQFFCVLADVIAKSVTETHAKS